ncbi:acyl carrier protein [Streptomyces formicae]|uniref:Carrier domain-containing protein n=1 Tax=Streptomyces formicae TaxID=1616117 RepID=A0ABY3WQ71_9ACTN|nr:phosphopantetheine-binding protein [Streptomyces formicae]UNM14788.1 hypothetical protein J4032_27950 [Streptomyces formicae]
MTPASPQTHDATEMVRRAVLSVLPELSDSELDPHSDLIALGANSLDRVDLVLNLEVELGAKLPIERVAAARTIGQLIEIVRAHERRH